jgi:hypothetical protein
MNRRPRALGDPAGERPVAHLALGDEAGRAHRLHHEDIEPGDVVRGDHHARTGCGRWVAFEAHGHSHDAQQLGRPPSVERAAPLGTHAREDQPQDERRGERVPHHPRPAQGAQRPAGALVNA